MKIRFCPKCKDTRINAVAGGKIGIWECVNCGFRSTIFPEIVKKEKVKKKKPKKKRRGENDR